MRRRHSKSLKPAELQVLAYLKYVGTGNGYLEIGTILNMTRSTAYRSVRRLVLAILAVFADEVRWPTRAESNVDEMNFYYEFGVRGVRGAMYGTDVHIRTSSQETAVAY
jgi:hypothetical protein